MADLAYIAHIHRCLCCFRTMLQELHLHPRTKWLTLKGRLRDDRRYRAVPRGNREGVFNLFVAELEVRLRRWRLLCRASACAVMSVDSSACAGGGYSIWPGVSGKRVFAIPMSPLRSGAGAGPEAQAGKVVPEHFGWTFVLCIHSGKVQVTGRAPATVACVEQW